MLKPAYALVGADVFLQLQKLGELLRSAGPDIQRLDVEGEKAEIGQVLDELRSFSMFSSAKLLVVREADDFVSRFRDHLEAYLAKPVSNSTLVLRMDSLPANQRIYKLINACGQVLDCKPPKDLVKWVIDWAKQAHKLTIGQPAAQMLVELIGADLGRLDSELAKLALQTSGPVDAATISQTVSFQREQEIWDMTNQVAAGNVTAAVERWRHLVQLDPSAEFRAVTWLTIWLEKTRKALVMRRQGQSDAAIVRELKIFPFDQQKAFMQTATALGPEGVTRLLNILANLDHRSKTGLGEMAANVERFLLAAGRR